MYILTIIIICFILNFTKNIKIYFIFYTLFLIIFFYNNLLNYILCLKNSNILFYLYKLIYIITDIDTNIFFIFFISLILMYNFFGIQLTILPLIILYNFEYQNIINYENINLFSKTLNINLINGLYLLHPFSLLLFFSLLFLFIINKIKKKKKYIYNNKLTNWLLFLNFIVLVTGG